MQIHRPSLKQRLARCGVAMIFILMASPAPVLMADTTGLNNIPTADTPGDRNIVFQGKLDLSDDFNDRYRAGFKMGLKPFDVRFEWGLDKQVGEDAMPAVFQLKFALDFSDDATSLGLGVANLGVRSKDRAKVGQPFQYMVLTHDFGAFRGHIGYGLQQNNNAAFFGFDKTISFFDRDLMLRTDFIQIDDQEQWLGSAGFIYFLDEHFAIESWVSVPLERGEAAFTLKLDVGFTF